MSILIARTDKNIGSGNGERDAQRQGTDFAMRGKCVCSSLNSYCLQMHRSLVFLVFFFRPLSFSCHSFSSDHSCSKLLILDINCLVSSPLLLLHTRHVLLVEPLQFGAAFLRSACLDVFFLFLQQPNNLVRNITELIFCWIRLQSKRASPVTSVKVVVQTSKTFWESYKRCCITQHALRPA